MHIDMGICTYIVHASLIRLCHQIIHKHSCRNSENIAASHWRRRGFSINFNNEPASTEGLLASWTPPQTHTMLKRMASTEHIFNAPQNHTVSFFLLFNIIFLLHFLLLLLHFAAAGGNEAFRFFFYFIKFQTDKMMCHADWLWRWLSNFHCSPANISTQRLGICAFVSICQTPNSKPLAVSSAAPFQFRQYNFLYSILYEMNWLLLLSFATL